jgi:alpha-tubulin suppressor-like RCC1 family protein
MAATEKGVWGLQEVRDKQLASEWSYDGTSELWAWGRGNNGQMGTNITDRRSSPVQIPGATWSTELEYQAINGSHVVMNKTDGTLWAWGKNTDWGQLGLNNRTNNFSSPVQIGTDTDWKIGGTFREGSFGVKTDGTLWTWGDGRSGSAGINKGGYPAVKSSPTQVGTDSTWDKAYGGSYHMFAIKTDGTLWSWGYNANGRLALNTPGVPGSRVSSPTQVGTDTNWDQVSVVDGYGNGGIKTDGTLWMWGYNNNGAAGQNSTSTPGYSSPTQVGTDTTWRKYSSGNEQQLAVKTDGTLWTWASNGSKGALGLNQGPAQADALSSPTQIGTNTNWNDIRSSSYGAMATKTDGSLWTWGRNDSGLLGINSSSPTLTAVSSPTQVPGTAWDTVGTTASSQLKLASKLI